MLRWEKGRRGSGYRKMCLWQGKSADCYIIDTPAGTLIPMHTDPVVGKKHYRLNILMYGEQQFIGEVLWGTKRIKLFRPDIMPHAVLRSKKRRVVLSFGWAV